MGMMDDLELPASGREWAELREQRELSIRELSDLTGLRAETIYRLEATGSATRSTRILVAAACGVPVFDREAVVA